MCSFIQTTVTQVIRIMPSFCKKHLSIKNNKNYNQNTIKRPARIEKNYYHVPQGDFCKPSSCYQQTEVIELLAEAITSAYFWCMRWLYGLHSSNSSMQNAALSYSCSCKYISHSSSHASESLMCLQQIQTEFPSFTTSDNSLPSHLTRRQWQACRSMPVPEHPWIHRWIDNPKT